MERLMGVVRRQCGNLGEVEMAVAIQVLWIYATVC